ncbi:unnamed protein product [Angiostrongylus costaricensis]|uniref:Tyrosine-protein phosphatase domain-containing protein n=1 Tax=Angiostrongylus costaricensis TaxID=334426 RepID=A0A3P7HG43_ANGCS|nr:unnamed protein product [Angiostrongylus costaricensis]
MLEFLLFESGGGYIHANRVTYPLLRNEFIITQVFLGPLPRTVSDFWRMIWQEKVETIFMLCKNYENGKRKCAEYFSNFNTAICLEKEYGRAFLAWLPPSEVCCETQ